jgi:hypothetical protein
MRIVGACPWTVHAQDRHARTTAQNSSMLITFSMNIRLDPMPEQSPFERHAQSPVG